MDWEPASTFDPDVLDWSREFASRWSALREERLPATRGFFRSLEERLTLRRQRRSSGARELTYGVGQIRVGGRRRPAVLIDQSAVGEMGIRDLEDPELVEFLAPVVGKPPAAAVVVAVPTPGLQMQSGEVIVAADHGTLGVIAFKASGEPCLVTAGHVAGQTRQQVMYTGRLVGDVGFCANPKTTTSDPTVDVGLVELNATGNQLLGNFLHVKGTVELDERDRLSLITSRGTDTAGILGRFPRMHMPGVNSLILDVYVTDRAISVAGDSGSAATTEDGEHLVGHLIGGDAVAHSYIEAAQVQLHKAGVTV